MFSYCKKPEIRQFPHRAALQTIPFHFILRGAIIPRCDILLFLNLRFFRFCLRNTQFQSPVLILCVNIFLLHIISDIEGPAHATRITLPADEFTCFLFSHLCQVCPFFSQNIETQTCQIMQKPLKPYFLQIRPNYLL